MSNLQTTLKETVPLISCTVCDNWVEWSHNDPRRKVDGYGFEFLGDAPADDKNPDNCYGLFKCQCGAAAKCELIEVEEEE